MTKTIEKGENVVKITLTLELLNLFRQHAGEEDMNVNFWMVKRILKEPEIEKELIDRYGLAEYQKQLEHFSKTNIVQREERKLKEAEKMIRESTRQQANEEIEKLKSRPSEEEESEPEPEKQLEYKISRFGVEGTLAMERKALKFQEEKLNAERTKQNPDAEEIKFYQNIIEKSKRTIEKLEAKQKTA
jgi:arginine utilization protein RocB